MTAAFITAVGGIFAGFTGAFFIHFFTRRRELERESEARRREFRVFLYKWRSQLQRIDHRDTKAIWQHYLGSVDECYAQIARVRTDYAKSFLEMAARLGGLRFEEITQHPDNKNPRDVIAEAIDALIKYRESPFTYKGWNRLVIALCAAYFILIVFLVIHEHGVINVFDQFDKISHHYQFWVWSPPEVLSASEHHLQPRIGFIAALMILPPLAFAGAVYSTLWVYRGFRTSHESATPNTALEPAPTVP
jgi:hypothetical protein